MINKVSYSKKLTVLFIAILSLNVGAEGEQTKKVFISPVVVSINVNHNGKVVNLKRNQDRDNEISDFYLPTTRGKIQPMHPSAQHLVARSDGIPTAKIKYFRGGMQNWKALDLTTVSL